LSTAHAGKYSATTFNGRGRFLADEHGAVDFMILHPKVIDSDSASLTLLLHSIARLLGVGQLVNYHRPPHFHAYVSAPGRPRLVTQLYVLDKLPPAVIRQVQREDPARAGSHSRMKDALRVSPALTGKAFPRYTLDYDFLLDRYYN
jgi:protocatechuate 3,4-dioxygenase beta subunit